MTDTYFNTNQIQMEWIYLRKHINIWKISLQMFGKTTVILIMISTPEYIF